MQCNACTIVQTRDVEVSGDQTDEKPDSWGFLVSPLRTFAQFCGLSFLHTHYFLVFPIGMTIALLTVEFGVINPSVCGRCVEVIYETVNCLRRF
jgi:hypothetical protein